MTFNLRSGNSSGLKFKSMGSSPAKGIFSKEEKKEPDPALTRDVESTNKFASPNKMDPSMIMGAMGSMGGGGGGGGGGEPDKVGMKLDVTKHT